MQNSDLRHAISQSGLLSDSLHRMLGAEASVDTRGRIAIAYLSICLDHREAILLLMHFGAFASATALQRPLLEALMSGVWIDGDATSEEMQNIATLTRPPPTFEKMVQRLRKVHAFGKWFEILREHYGIFGDYAHGHGRQLSRWLSPSGVAPQYSDEQMIEILRYSDVIGLLAAIFREKIAGHPTEQLTQMLDELMQRHKSCT